MALRHLLLTLLCMVWASAATAQSFPALTGRVVDDADLLSVEQEAQLTQLSREIEQAASRQFVVVTLPSLQGYEIADFGYRLGRFWKIGQQGADNGILLIVAPNERKVRIEVGYGLEPVMTDALASLIVNQTILPRFRDGDMAGGIVAGAQAIGEQMKLPLEAAEKRAQAELAAKPRRGRGGDTNWVPILFWTVVILFFVLPAIFGGRRGRRYRRGRAPVVIWGPGWGGGGGSSWGSGSSWGGGGGFSGGGGSFGGGGASGSW